MQTLTITQPDDWHLHLRDGAFLSRTVSDSAARFARAIVMPNLSPPVTTAAHALAYRERVMQACPEDLVFQPLMTLYLTDVTTAATINACQAHPDIAACKLYPAGATTLSEWGVTDIEKTYPALAAMEELGMPLLLHGEVTDPQVDIFDREKVFIDTVLMSLQQRFPKLPMVLEHITTADAAAFVQDNACPIAATITPHHLLLERNDLLSGGIHPHYYCLPILKRRQHQEALLAAATSGNAKFFLGTDSAPHTQDSKESACGCAGIYTAHAAIELCAEIFDAQQALSKLEGFTSHFGADFYKRPRNTTKLTLKKQAWQVPERLSFGESQLVPFRGGESVQWKIVSGESIDR